jgi:hypothetical protein
MNGPWKIAIALLGLAGAVAGGGTLLARTFETHGGRRLGDFDGARLGMTAAMVRDRFEEGASGAWEVDPNGSLAWTSSAERPKVVQAHFEFHNAQLVAIRARGTFPEGPRIESSDAVLVARTPGSITILARDCPEHAAEVGALLGETRK